MVFFKKHFSPKNIFLFVAVSLIVNLGFFHLGLNTYKLSWHKPYKITGDSYDYVGSSENVLRGNDFTFYKTNEDKEFPSNFIDPNKYNKEIYYAFRSPGFSMFYLPFRLLFNQHISLIIFLLLQVIVTAFAKYYISKLGQTIFSSTAAFYIIFLLINITPYFTQYNNLLLTDSLGASFIIFFSYTLLLFFEEKDLSLNKKKAVVLFLSGLFLTIAIMLRPFLAVFLVAASLLFLYKYYNVSYRKLFTSLIIFLSSFAVIDGAWTVRNFIHTKKFIPLASTIKFHDHKHLAYFEIKNVSAHLGYSQFWWNKESPVYWLVNATDTRSASDIFHNHADDTSLIQVLEEVKITFNKSLDTSYSLVERKAFEKKTQQSLIELQKQQSHDHYLSYQWESRFYMLFRLLDVPNVKALHQIKYPLNVFFVFIQTLVTKSVTFVGLFSLFICLFFIRTKNQSVSVVFWGSTLALVLLFGVYKMYDEHRELYTLYSFMLTALIGLICFTIKRFKLGWMVIFLVGVGVCFVAYKQTLIEIKW